MNTKSEFREDWPPENPIVMCPQCGKSTRWTPSEERSGLFPRHVHAECPWICDFSDKPWRPA